MSQIKISCVGSTAVFTNTPDIFSGGNVDEVKFEFDKEWVDFPYKTAVFYTNPKETDVQILDTNNVAKIPPNMIAKKGKLSIGVIGTDTNDNVKTSKILTYVVGKGAVTDDMETTAPTPDIWLQMLSIVKHNKDIVDDMELIVDESQMSNKANKDLSNVDDVVLKNKAISLMTTGTYIGTGNPVSVTLTFDFEPKIVIVSGQGISNPGLCILPVIMVKGCTHTYSPQSTTDTIDITWEDNSIRFYGVRYIETNMEYHYIALG